MTEEEWKAFEIDRAEATISAALSARRIDRLEREALAQRTAILRLERAARLICKSLWAIWAVNMLLALAVLT